MKVKEKSLQTLIKEADEWFSLYIRLEQADKYGYILCACGCGKRIPWKQSQCSHMAPRTYMIARYDIRNACAATRECNYYDEKHADKIAEYLEAKHGQGNTLYVRMLISGRPIWKLVRPEVAEIRDTYKAKFNELKKKKGL